jgi:hypothetical protein
MPASALNPSTRGTKKMSVFGKKDPEKQTQKERIALARSSLEQTKGTLSAWGPETLVIEYRDDADKDGITKALQPLGWHYEPDPGDDEACLMQFRFKA